MPTKKIADPPKFCSNPEPNPPSMMVFPPGTYEHTWPVCGRKMTFTVPAIRS